MENEKFQDLVLEHLARLTQKITGIKNEMTGFKNEISGIKNEMTGFKKETQENFAKIETRIENEIIDKIRSLYDAREVQSDVNERIISTLGRIETKMDVLQLETASIRRVKNKTAK